MWGFSRVSVTLRCKKPPTRIARATAQRRQQLSFGNSHPVVKRYCQTPITISRRCNYSPRYYATNQPQRRYFSQQQQSQTDSNKTVYGNEISNPDDLYQIAFMEFENGRPEKASRVFLSAARKYMDTEGRAGTNTIKCIYNYACALSQLEMYNEAKQSFVAVLQNYKSYGGPRELDVYYIDAMRELGQTNFTSFDFQRGLQCLYHAQQVANNLIQKALETSNNIPDDLAIARGMVYDSLAKAFIVIENTPEAEVMANEAVRVMKEVGKNPKGLIDATVTLATVYLTLHKFDISVKLLEEILPSSTFAPTLHASVLCTLGVAYLSQGKIDESEKSHQKALDIYVQQYGMPANEDENPHPKIVDQWHNLATVAYMRGDFESAWEQFQRVYIARVNKPGPHLANLLASMVEVLQNMGRFEEAAAFEKQREQLDRLIESKLNLARQADLKQFANTTK